MWPIVWWKRESQEMTTWLCSSHFFFFPLILNLDLPLILFLHITNYDSQCPLHTITLTQLLNSVNDCFRDLKSVLSTTKMFHITQQCYCLLMVCEMIWNVMWYCFLIFGLRERRMLTWWKIVELFALTLHVISFGEKFSPTFSIFEDSFCFRSITHPRDKI